MRLNEIRKKVLFLTSTNLAANPRLVKELRLASMHGFSCTVVQFRLGNWSDAMSAKLEREFENVKFVYLSALRSPFLPWLQSSLLEKIYRQLPETFLSGKWLSVAIGKRSLLLLRYLGNVSVQYDWVIAHNPACFYPAFVFAKKSGACLGIDVEDFHPGETTVQKASSLLIKLFRNVLPLADYISYASDSILQKTNSVVSFNKNKKQLTVINGFPSGEFAATAPPISDSLQLVWFSQFIDKGRGLEPILAATRALYPKVELHLIGNMKEPFFQEEVSGVAGVIYHPPMPQKELHRLLSSFDVGLALEPGRDENNQLALSNKLLAYAQAGLFIVASHTKAQDLFLQDSRLAYVQTDLVEEQLVDSLLQLYYRKDEVRQNRSERFATGRQYDWEIISNDLIAIWNSKLV
jgi:glycosyltransferase involved in cell wall biosynthesis